MSSAEQRLDSFLNTLSDSEKARYQSRIDALRIRQAAIRARTSSSATPGATPSAPPDQPTVPGGSSGGSPGGSGIPNIGTGISHITDEARALGEKKRKDAADALAAHFGGTTGDVSTIVSTAQSFKDKFDEAETEEEKEKRRREATGALSSLPFSRALQPSHDKLESVEIERAHLAKAGKIMSQHDVETAQQYLNQQGMEDYVIDPELSTTEGLVVTNPEGKIEISYRGTNKTNLSDLATDVQLLAGTANSSQQFKDAQALYEAAKAKYGAVDHVSGFSLGGSKALKIGEFNPEIGGVTAINPFLGVSQGSYDPRVETTILRTTSDPVSLGLVGTKLGSKVKVKSVNPVNNSLNPIKSHLLNNFTDRTNNRVADTHMNQMVKHTVRSAAKAAEYTLLDAASEGADKGQSFTDWIDDFNSGSSGGRDTVRTEGGVNLLSGKIAPEHNYTRSWLDAGGDFDKSEIDSLLNKTPAKLEDKGAVVDPEDHATFLNHIEDVHNDKNDLGLSVDERTDFVLGTDAERNGTIKESTQEAIDAADDLTDFSAPIEQANPGFADNLKAALHPTGLVTGLLSGYAASKAMEMIDPKQRLGDFGDTAAEGALSGGFSALASAALTGGELALVPEVGAGALAYLTTKYSKKGINYLETALGAKEGGEFEEITGDIASDALGGAAAGALLGGPVGALVGGGVGAIIGGATALFSSIF